MKTTVVQPLLFASPVYYPDADVRDEDVRVVGREQPLAENAQIVLQRRKKLNGGFRWNCHDSAHILSLF